MHVDFSIPPHESRKTTGTLSQILLCAHNKSKPLMAPDIPTSSTQHAIVKVASDAHAWNMTIDQPWCARRWEMPRSLLCWAEVSTKHAYSSVSFAPNGFATQIEVKSGSQLLLIFQPRQSHQDIFQYLLQVKQPLSMNWDAVVSEAFHLTEGNIA